MNNIKIVESNKNYSVGNIGGFDQVGGYSYLHSRLNMDIDGKVFVGEALNMSGMEISFQIMEPKKEIPFYHKHIENEEVYIVLKGNGEFEIDDKTIQVSEGSIVRIAPEGKRKWRNNSEENLIVMIIQAKNNSLNKFTVTDGILA